MAGITRVCDVSEPWLQSYINGQYASVHHEAQISSKKGRMTIQCDEMWSFIGNKGNEQWIWLALDVKTRELVGVHMDDCFQVGARKLWESLPPVYRQCAVVYTDFWQAYKCVMPGKRH